MKHHIESWFTTCIFFFKSIKKKHPKATTWIYLTRSLQLFMYVIILRTNIGTCRGCWSLSMYTAMVYWYSRKDYVPLWPREHHLPHTTSIWNVKLPTSLHPMKTCNWHWSLGIKKGLYPYFWHKGQDQRTCLVVYWVA